MVLPDIYSRRAGLTGPHSDILAYANFTVNLRRQLLFAMIDGTPDFYGVNIWAGTVALLAEEMRVHNLTRNWQTDEYPEQSFKDWIETNVEPHRMLDALDLWAQLCFAQKGRLQSAQLQDLERAISVINERFREAGIGFRFCEGKIIKITSQILHEEVSSPALSLLAQPYFSAANDEFLKAYEYFKSGDFEGCNVECCKALESMLKILGDRYQWGLKGTEALAALFKVAREKDFIPSEMIAQFTQLSGFLECGVGTTRNKSGGHGSGTRSYAIPEHLAALQLHQTAAVILFLGACEREYK